MPAAEAVLAPSPPAAGRGLCLVLGGTRSGKSAVAEGLVAGCGTVVYVATGSASDDEMAVRIAAHRHRRPESWRTVESTRPADAVRAAPAGAAVLVDDLGGWLARRMDDLALWPAPDCVTAPLADDDAAALLVEVDDLAVAAGAHDGPVVVVAGEAGLGVVPPDAGTRRWLDLAGEASQRLAASAARVLLVVAGRAIELPAGPSTPARTGDRPPSSEAIVPDAERSLQTSEARRPHGDVMVPQGALDLAVNVEIGPAPHVRAVLERALDAAGGYPDESAARAAVAARHGRPADEVLLTAGAADALWLLARVVRAQRAAVVVPTFTEAEAALAAVGVNVVPVHRRPEDGWALRPEAVPNDADLVVLGNPNNPTGALDPPESVARLCRPGRVVVVDEAFVDFVVDVDLATLAARRDLPGLAVVRSATKLWAVPGVRAGWVLAPPGLVARCAAARPPWAVSGPALAVLELAARDEAHRRAVAARVAEERDALVAALRDVPGVTVWPAAANFVLLHVPDGPRALRILGAQGIAVRRSTFTGLDEHHLRVAVRGDATRLVAGLREAVATPSGAGRAGHA